MGTMMGEVFSSTPYPGRKDINPIDYFCDVCDASMKYRDHKQHIRGKKHRLNIDKIKAAEIAANPPVTDEWTFEPNVNAAGDAAGGDGCFNCGKPGHRKNECTEPRKAREIECRKCKQMGHMAKDCTAAESVMTCRNCNQPGHMGKECTEPKNPANMKCRNCDAMGHASRDCTAPKDWSRVTCNNCGEKGHTVRRCKNPPADNTLDGGFDSFGTGGFDAAPAAPGGWADTPASGDCAGGDGATNGAAGETDFAGGDGGENKASGWDTAETEVQW